MDDSLSLCPGFESNVAGREGASVDAFALPARVGNGCEVAGAEVAPSATGLSLDALILKSQKREAWRCVTGETMRSSPRMAK